MQHKLKIWPEYFGPVISGEKTFEVRKNDRDFKIGDTLVLEEYVVDYIWERSYYTGRTVKVEVTYILDGPLAVKDLCIMSIKKVN